MLFPLFLPAKFHDAGVPMPSYDSFKCPNCEHHFRVIWLDPMPSHHDPCSKIIMKCPDCGEVTELYDFLIDKILQAPEPGIRSVEVLSISPRDPNPDPNARSNYWHLVWACREAKYRATYRPTK
jgi:predicted RNA-binding Zn-ribbon protein involved in translation (DUF1610 family)